MQCLRSIAAMDRNLSELCCKGTLLQRNYRKIRYYVARQDISAMIEVFAYLCLFS